MAPPFYCITLIKLMKKCVLIKAGLTSDRVTQYIIHKTFSAGHKEYTRNPVAQR